MKQTLCHVLCVLNILCAMVAVFHRENYLLGAFAFLTAFASLLLSRSKEAQ